MNEDKQRAKLIHLMREHRHTKKELAHETHTTVRDLEAIIRELKEMGVPIQTNNGRSFIESHHDLDNRYVMSKAKKKLTDITIGACADFHMACKQHNNRRLHEYVDRAVDLGVTDFFMAGDIVDGHKVYRGQINSLVATTIGDQVDIAAEGLPERDGIMWYMIGGNHDYSHTQANGARPLRRLAEIRPDVIDLGDFKSDIVVDGATIRLVHGSGGRNAYAVSYPVQVYVRNLSEGGVEALPDMLVMGHFHRAAYFILQNTHCLMPGNFQAPNEFTTTRGFIGPQGGFVVDATIKEGKIQEITPKWLQCNT